MRSSILSAAILTLGLAACGTPETAEPTDEVDLAVEDTPQMATAELMTADGERVGTATATEREGGVEISLAVSNMEPGEHGVHVHMTGSCSPDFSAAGGHWNPTDEAHGLEDPAGQHAGDMPNLEVGEDGTGSIDYMLQGGATFAGLTDADGSAFIVHAGRDDQVTDPAGDSGDRIACGVFQTDGAMAEDAPAM